MPNDVCDPISLTGRGLPSLISATRALTWKETFSEVIVFSVKLTLKVNFFSNSLVISSRINPGGLLAMYEALCYLSKHDKLSFIYLISSCDDQLVPIELQYKLAILHIAQKY